MECNKDEAIRSKSIAETRFQQKDFLGAKKFAQKAQTLYPRLEGISQMLTMLNMYLSGENKISGEIDSNMQCNKDEAIRSKSIAERKFEQKDYSGAKKFALKAQTLCPGLEGISQMLTMLNVYLSAEKKISGEIDWYGVLDVKPSADEETIKKQYRKLALMLHPDKNNSVGADGGFNLISEARRMLLDTEKRASYDKRRGTKGVEQKAPTHTGGPSTVSRPNKLPGSQSGTPKPEKVPPAPTRKSRKKVPSEATKPSQKKVPVNTDGQAAPPQPGLKKSLSVFHQGMQWLKSLS